MQPQSAPPQPPPPSAAPQQPIFIEIPQGQPDNGNIKDVIVGSFGLTGALVLGAVLSGATLGALWIVIRKWRRTYESDAPPTLGSVPLGVAPPNDSPATAPTSSPDR
jgi:hypothetical protein